MPVNAELMLLRSSWPAIGCSEQLVWVHDLLSQCRDMLLCGGTPEESWL